MKNQTKEGSVEVILVGNTLINGKTIMENNYVVIIYHSMIIIEKMVR